MLRKNLVNGLTVSSLDDYDRVCEGCALGKSHHLPFPEVSTTKYEKMGLIVVDLAGPMSVETWTEMQYALVTVEVSCQFPVGQLLQSKDEAATALKETVAMLKRQSRKLLE